MRELVGKLLANFWKPGAVVYLGFCLAGLLAGLWIEVIYVNPNAFTAPPLPVFHTLGIAQVLFFLLVWPLIILRRHKTNPTSLPVAIIEIIGFFTATVPFYFVAAKFSDATLTDSLRTLITVAAFCPLGLAAGRVMTYDFAQPWVLLGLVVITIALVGLYYIVSEFLHEVPADWIWDVSPVTFTWTNTTQRIPTLFPEPLWVWCFWIFISVPICVMPTKSQIKLPCQSSD